MRRANGCTWTAGRQAPDQAGDESRPFGTSKKGPHAASAEGLLVRLAAWAACFLLHTAALTWASVTAHHLNLARIGADFWHEKKREDDVLPPYKRLSKFHFPSALISDNVSGCIGSHAVNEFSAFSTRSGLIPIPWAMSSLCSSIKTRIA